MVCNKNYFSYQNNCNLYFDNGSVQLDLCNKCSNSGLYDPINFQNGGFCYELINGVDSNDFVLYGKVKSWMQDVFKQFYGNGCIISSNQDNVDYHPIQPDLYNVCFDFNNLCSFALGGTTDDSFSVCKNNKFISQQYVKSDLSVNRNLAFFCGCYLSNNNYISTVPIECDSLCGAEQAIKLFDNTNNQIRCQNGICAISDITINVYQSSIGDINFNQICGGVCGGISCNRCYLENISIDILTSKVGDINLVQKCGGENATAETAFQCWSTDENGNFFTTACEIEDTNTFNTNLIVFISIIVIVIVIILFLLILLIIKNKSIKVTNDEKVSNEYKISTNTYKNEVYSKSP